jgi:hypothetical protein
LNQRISPLLISEDRPTITPLASWLARPERVEHAYPSRPVQGLPDRKKKIANHPAILAPIGNGPEQGVEEGGPAARVAVSGTKSDGRYA